MRPLQLQQPHLGFSLPTHRPLIFRMAESADLGILIEQVVEYVNMPNEIHEPPSRLAFSCASGQRSVSVRSARGHCYDLNGRRFGVFLCKFSSPTPFCAILQAGTSERLPSSWRPGSRTTGLRVVSHPPAVTGTVPGRTSMVQLDAALRRP